MGKAIVSYLKVAENSTNNETVNPVTGDKLTNNRNDIQIYALDLPIKAGDMTVRPGFMYFQGGKEAVNAVTLNGVGAVAADYLQELSAYNAALNFTGNFGLVSLDATAAYLGGSSKPSGVKEKFAAYAADVLLTIKPSDTLKAGLFFTMTSGDKNSTADKDENYMATMHAITGGGYTSMGRLFLMNYQGVWTNGCANIYDQGDTNGGLMIYGANVEAKMDKLTLFAQVGYVTVAEDNGGDSVIGTEADLRASYEVAPKTNLFAEAGYIMAGDDSMMVGTKYIKAEDAYMFAWGISTSI
jgi:hypothetical protein